MATARIIIPIDQAGRVVLPKEIRERFGLRGGAEFEVIEEAERIVLKPVEQPSKMIRKDGILVFVPEKDFTRYDEEDPVKAAREERDRKFL